MCLLYQILNINALIGGTSSRTDRTQRLRKNAAALLTDLRHLHRQGAGRFLRRHVPPPPSAGAPPTFLDEGSDPAGVHPSILGANALHQHPVLPGSRLLEAGLGAPPLRAARVGDDHAAALHGDDVVAVCQPAHLQGEGGQVFGGDRAEEGQGVAGGEQQSRGGGRGEGGRGG